jgi:hypothetical protein
VDKVGVDTLWFLHQFDHREALQDLLSQDYQLHLRQTIADTAMHAEAEGSTMNAFGSLIDSSSRLPETYDMTTLSPVLIVLPPALRPRSPCAAYE